jgi:hypothetical protein
MGRMRSIHWGGFPTQWGNNKKRINGTDEKYTLGRIPNSMGQQQKRINGTDEKYTLGRIPNSMGQQQKTYQWDG